MIPIAEFWGSNQSKNPPLTDQLLAKAEERLRVRLPAEYVELLRIQNGGPTTGLAFPMRVRTTWADDHVPMEGLAGIASNRFENPHYNILQTEYITEEWGLPPKQILLTGDGHWWLTLDYRKSDEPAVTWLDVECGEDIVVAPTFRAFLHGLVPESQFDETLDEAAPTEAQQWQPKRIQATVGELQTPNGPVPCIRLTQTLAKGETGWSMSVLVTPANWSVASLEFRASDLCMTLADGRTFKINGDNQSALTTAILQCPTNDSAALETAWATHASD